MIKQKYLLLLSLLILATNVLIAQPNWTINPNSFDYNMTITGVVNLNYIESTDADDIVAAFIDGECRGLTKAVYQASSDRYVYYLFVYSSELTGIVNFKVYDASEDAEIELEATETFNVNEIIGSTSAPYVWSSPTLSNKAEMLDFSIPDQSGSTIIDGTNISLKMPYGTDLSSLIANYDVPPVTLVKINDVVQISGETLNDFSNPVNYWVRSADETSVETYTVTISYANYIPSDIFLSANEISENADIGAVVGLLTTEDFNEEDVHSYSLVMGNGDDDNNAFSILGNELQLNTSLDFETQSSYSIRIETNDNQGGLFEKEFTIDIIDEEEIFDAVTVFSPNNDGINDYWEIQDNYQFRNCKFFIFNSIGEIVFESTGYNNDWNGTYKDKQVPVGTYYYVIKCSDCANCNYTGSISIIR